MNARAADVDHLIDDECISFNFLRPLTENCRNDVVVICNSLTPMTKADIILGSKNVSIISRLNILLRYYL